MAIVENIWQSAIEVGPESHFDLIAIKLEN